MNTTLLMSTSAVGMALAGLAAVFMPGEIMTALGGEPSGNELIVVQIAGALYIAFATINWMSRNAPIGGIYGRPFVLANFLHAAIVAIGLIRGVLGEQDDPPMIVLSLIYAVFAFWFGSVLFFSSSPSIKED